MKILIIASAVIARVVQLCLPEGFEADSVVLGDLGNCDLKQYGGFFVSNGIIRIGEALDVLDAHLEPTWSCIIHDFDGPMDNDVMYYMPWQRSSLAEITDLTPDSIRQALIKVRLLEPIHNQQAA